MGVTPGMAWLQTGVHPLFVTALMRGGYQAPKAVPIGFGDSFTRTGVGAQDRRRQSAHAGEPAPQIHSASVLDKKADSSIMGSL